MTFSWIASIHFLATPLMTSWIRNLKGKEIFDLKCHQSLGQETEDGVMKRIRNRNLIACQLFITNGPSSAIILLTFEFPRESRSPEKGKDEEKQMLGSSLSYSWDQSFDNKRSNVNRNFLSSFVTFLWKRLLGARKRKETVRQEDTISSLKVLHGC